MASIQQSLNQLLGATAGAATMGSYMYRQSDTHKIKTLERRQTKLDEASSQLGEMAIDELAQKLGKSPAELTKKDLEGFYETQSGAASGDVNIELANTARELLQLQPSKERAEMYSAYKGNVLDKERAEQVGFDRLTKSTETQLTQRQALKERFDFLKAFSAKERGQFETAYNRHKNKGEID